MNVIALHDHPRHGHPRQEELADYVDDTLGPEQVEHLESHVFQCSHCAARLQQAASFQMLLHEAAEATPAEYEASLPSLADRIRRHVGTVGGLWAAAAAFTLVIWQHGDIEIPESKGAVLAAYDSGSTSEAEPWSVGCRPGDPGCADGLLASFANPTSPLESIDPLSSWPDDPLMRSGFAESDIFDDGEPCGSGEDGGPLVCPRSPEPFGG